MHKAKELFGYLWACVSILILAVMVISSQMPVEKVNALFPMKISERISGGEIHREIRHQGYDTLIYHPVFEGIFADRKDGFVQVEWVSGSGQLPVVLIEDIDYDNDGEKDFTVRLTTKTEEAAIEEYNPEIRDPERIEVYRYENLIGLRVSLKRP
jgi:hypothetical protein